MASAASYDFPLSGYLPMIEGEIWRKAAILLQPH